MELVSVHTTFSPVDADLVRARLEVAGFHPVISGLGSALSMEGYSLSTGGILVQVPDTEAREAVEFLKSAGAPPPA